MEENINWPGWKTEGSIGRGGFGQVYKIRRNDEFGISEEAALKVIVVPQDSNELEYLISEGFDEESITKQFHGYVGDIVREYKLMIGLRNCPNIVHCDDCRVEKQENGIGWNVYIKMELLTPLMKVLDLVTTEDQIIRLGRDLCHALATCQKHNILHRDIKPQNIFLAADGNFKLGDFGISRTAERTTHATVGIGTYNYMAPEVISGEPYGPSADIYSLGMVLYWLLNERRLPFLPLPPETYTTGMAEEARKRRFRGEKINMPVNGSMDLKRIVLKACSFRPADRYSSAQEMMNELSALFEKKQEIKPEVPAEAVMEYSTGKVSNLDESTIVEKIHENKAIAGKIDCVSDSSKNWTGAEKANRKKNLQANKSSTLYVGAKKHNGKYITVVSFIALILTLVTVITYFGKYNATASRGEGEKINSEISVGNTVAQEVNEALADETEVVQAPAIESSRKESLIEYITNEQGQVIKTVYHSIDGTVAGWYISKFNEEGTEIHRELYDANGKSVTTREFRNDGSCYQASYPGSPWVWYNYDANGKLIDLTHYSGYGTPTSKVVFEYDDNGYNTAKIYYDDQNNETIITDIKSEFDAYGRIIKKSCYNGTQLTSWIEYEYDLAGNEIKNTTYDKDGKVVNWEDVEVDPQYYAEFRTTYDTDGNVLLRREVIYGEDGKEYLNVIYNEDGTIANRSLYFYYPQFDGLAGASHIVN